MKLTVLDMVQSALRSIGSDTVNSISDTPEAQDCAYILREVYFNMIGTRDWPHLRQVIRPTASGSGARPTVMLIEDEVQKIYTDTMYYDKREQLGDDPDIQLVDYLYPDQFLYRQASLSDNVSDSNIQAVTVDDLTYYIYNDRAPRYYTSINDERLLFDSFDNTVDSTLQSSKAMLTVYTAPSFDLVDTFIPDLPAKNFPELLAEFKSTVFIEIAQEANPKQEQTARRHRSWAGIEKHRARKEGFRHASHYGRK